MIRSMTRLPKLLLALPLALVLPACGDSGSESESGTESSESDSETSGDTESSSSDAATASSTGGSDGSTSDTGFEPTWEPVACGDTTCAEGELCVQLGDECSYADCETSGTTTIITFDPMCAPVPEACESDPNLVQCLSDQLCEGSVELSTGDWSEGFLKCFPQYQDCFC